MEHETFFTLLFDKAHWEFELFLMAIFDGLLGALILPYLRKAWRHHKHDDDQIAKLQREMKELKEKLGMV